MRRLWLPGAFVGLIVLVALAAPLLGLPDPIRQDVANRLAGADAQALRSVAMNSVATCSRA